MSDLIRRHPLATYFGLTFIWSWGSALALLGPKWVSHQPIPTWYGLLTFPAMIVGPALASLGLTALLEGRPGLRRLGGRMRRMRVGLCWYAAACLLAPGLVVLVLSGLGASVSPVFTPGFFPMGFLFGPMAGFFEEIGWSGFAYPHLRQRTGALTSGIALGVVWGLWHLPVLDFMGAASPHGAWFGAYFAAFVGVVTPVRVLMGVVSEKTDSIFIAQLMHASLTGSLAAFSPMHVSAGQEAMWYAVYAASLWMVVAVLAWRNQPGFQTFGRTNQPAGDASKLRPACPTS
jgi:membrane protease YdiL (CAAX protease family)